MALHDNYNGYYANYQEPPFVRNNNHGDMNFNRDYYRGFYPHLEQVMVWREVGENVPSGGGPWWRKPDFPHGHPIQLIVEEPVCDERERADYEQQTTSSSSMELYVPLCCDHCERRVTRYLIDSPGVQSVSPSQWEKKVVVVGHNLRPNDLLQSLQRHLNLPHASFWEHRPCY